MIQASGDFNAWAAFRTAGCHAKRIENYAWSYIEDFAEKNKFMHIQPTLEPFDTAYERLILAIGRGQIPLRHAQCASAGSKASNDADIRGVKNRFSRLGHCFRPLFRLGWKLFMQQSNSAKLPIDSIQTCLYKSQAITKAIVIVIK
ncbi:MAG: hypothetical protein HZA67_04065 [Rhodospirillales bacterium]|jgi:hypothetical protein|nr:hypothetical protein [Rhodospirillales bacterium]